MPSFDIVSRIDLAEVENALAGMTREIGTRFDFKGSKCTIERQEGMLTLLADDELKLKQMHELLRGHLARRKVDSAALDYKPPEKASGNRLRQKSSSRMSAAVQTYRAAFRSNPNMNAASILTCRRRGANLSQTVALQPARPTRC